MLINDLKLDALDAAGSKVRRIYAKNPPFYAVYLAGRRVLVMFADDPATAKVQAVQLAALGSARDEIAGLVDGWRQDAKTLTRVAHFNERVASALCDSMSGFGNVADDKLARIKSEIVAERSSRAKFEYVAIAAMCVLITLCVSWIGLTTKAVHWLYPTLDTPSTLWAAIGGGALGAIFSVATGLNARTLQPDLRFRDNAVDASLRIFVGVISATIVLSLQKSGMITGLLFGDGATGHPVGSDTAVFVLGFLAGFSERMVPDLLGKITVESESSPSVAPETDANTDASSAGRNTVDAPASSINPATANDVADSCPCDAAPGPGEPVTADADLPPAIGGVAALVTPGDDNAGSACLCDGPPAAGDVQTSDTSLPAAQGGVSP